jgi:NADH:ubiquinone oxidoreductase subunit F (NADH-binding)
VSAPAVARLPRLLAGVQDGGPLDLEAHLAVHGHLPAQPKPKRGRPGELIDSIEAAGLRGRGGAGFPTAVKLHAVAGARGRGRTVVVNAAEGEPASDKDRTLLSTVPHLVLDGAILAAQVVSASEVILCVGEESPQSLRAATAAISERRRLRGEPAISLAVVPSGYVAGQESALVSFLNGNAAKPMFTPPMTFERGVRGRPTLLSNAETFAHIALIARHGAAWYRALGTPEHSGSTLVTLSGPVHHPGVYEIEHGASMRSLVDAAGGSREAIRAILVGGYAGTWLDGAELGAMTLDDGWLVPRGASTGAGVVILLGESACGVSETVRVARWLADESAGQCGPCVHGLAAIAERLEGLAWDRDAAGEHEVLRLASVIRGRGACRHPDGTLRLIASALEVFADEWADHARHGPCEVCTAQPALPLPDAVPPLAFEEVS